MPAYRRRRTNAKRSNMGRKFKKVKGSSANAKRETRGKKTTTWIASGSRRTIRPVYVKNGLKWKKSVNLMVKNVFKGNQNTGTYRKLSTGDIAPFAGTGESDNQDLIIVGHNKNNTNATPNTQDACRWTPLSAKRLLDAASVLYNAKTAANNFEEGVGNFESKSLHVDFIYASYHLEIINNTLLDYEYELYEVTAKRSSQVPFIDTIQELVNHTTFDFASTGATFGFTSPSDGKANKYLTPRMFQFQDTDLDQWYSHKIYSKGDFLKGKTISYFMAKKDFALDFWKTTTITTTDTTDTADLASYPKGDIQLVMRLRAKPHTYVTGSASGTALQNHSGDNSIIFPVVITEIFKLYQPEVTSETNSGNKVKLLQNCNKATGTYSSSGYVEHNGFTLRSTGATL